MNPSSGENRPAPQFEMPPPTEGPEQQHDKKMEQTGQSESGAGKHQPQAVTTQVMQLPTDIPAAAPVAIPSDTDQGAQDKADTVRQHEAAHDSHRIEKQWVDRAKRVIAQTRDNPHAQKHEMSQVKAEYIRTRFNKTIPTDGTAKP